jgi:hypothetical protein
MNKKTQADQTEATEFNSQYMSWYDDGLKKILDDNRRRYNMQLKDAKVRKDLGLSALPSTKSTSAVDRAVEKALMEYHGEPDAIQFGQRGVFNKTITDKARLLTEIFNYRCDNTFPFFSFHSLSLTAGYTDGLEAAMVSWVKESYKEKVEKFIYDDGSGPQEIDEQTFLLAHETHPQFVKVEKDEQEVVTKDTFWIDLLKPGEGICWDVKIPYLDLELCQRVLVKRSSSIDFLKSLHKNGILNKFDLKAIQAYQTTTYSDYDEPEFLTAADPVTADFGKLNHVNLWLFFKKINCRWHVQFSVEGKETLSTWKTVDDVFWAGRKVGLLPVVLGSIKSKLWEIVGRGLPESIAPIEDEWTDHRNNINDAAKQAIQGRFRIDHDAEVDLNQVLNARAFRANKGDIEKIDTNPNILDSLRATEALNQDLSEMVPVGMESRTIVPRGTSRTLGAVELSLGQQNEKLSVHLLHRNETYFKKVIHRVGHAILSFETDETIIRIAAEKAKVQPPTIDGQTVDLKGLDLDFQVRVNAGLGNMPKQQKANLIIEMADWRKSHGVPTDFNDVAKQLNVLAGFQEDAFALAEIPPPPGPELKGVINIDLAFVPEPMREAFLMKFMQEADQITAKGVGKTPKTPEGAGRPSDMVANPISETDVPAGRWN